MEILEGEWRTGNFIYEKGKGVKENVKEQRRGDYFSLLDAFELFFLIEVKTQRSISEALLDTFRLVHRPRAPLLSPITIT